MGLCCFAFVITLHTYLKLIGLISDKTVFCLSAAASSFLSGGFLCPVGPLGVFSLALRAQREGGGGVHW